MTRATTLTLLALSGGLALSALLLGCPAAATADHCGVVTGYRAASYGHAAKVQVQAHAAPYAVRHYYYVPYPDDDSLQREIQQLETLKQVLQLRQEVGALKSALAQSQPCPQPDDAPPAPASLAARHCLQCHGAAASAQKGGGITLFDGAAPLKLAGEDADALRRAVLSGRMPRGGKLSDGEKVDVIVEFTGN